MSQLAPHRATRRTVDLPDGPVSVLDSMPPPGVPERGTVLLVPGYTGSKEEFAPLLDPAAAAGYRLIAMDQPGQHESPGPDEPAAYTVDWLASVVCAVTKTLATGSVHLLGHSFGGIVTRGAAIAEPASFRSLTLVGSGPAAIGGPRRARMEALKPLLPLGIEAIYQAMERLAGEELRGVEPTPELRAFHRQRFVTSSLAGLEGMGEALLTEPDRVDELRATGVPVLVCHGEGDDAWSPATQARMALGLEARYEVIQDSLHSPVVENAARTLEVLVEFWQRNDM